MELRVIVAYLFGLGLLYLIARLLALPVRIVVRLVVNVLAGALLLAVVNFLGRFVLGVYVPINPVTALVAGLLGLPGVALLVALQYLLL
ncbi:MAG: pro-sigmaK processing inhibitor BofA family protein [Limnochordales bacterium]|jgi:pro-sigmaK processing inhibitor BofA|nr:SigmaK-factor processing regulatory BofA [Bacillota bacterium]